jgi:hypothetical protein
MTYAAWCNEIAKAAGVHNARIAFGPMTWDAWSAGVEPDEYAMAHRHWPKTPPNMRHYRQMAVRP